MQAAQAGDRAPAPRQAVIRPEQAGILGQSSDLGVVLAVALPQILSEIVALHVLASAKPSVVMNALHELRNLFDVASRSPMVGALPQDPGTPGGAPFLLGVTGTLR
jgi:hypothetical protein